MRRGFWPLLLLAWFGPQAAGARPDRYVIAASSPRALAVTRQAVAQLAPSPLSLASPRALARAEAHRSLRGVPLLYAKSEFDHCAQVVSHAERLLAGQRQPGELETLALLKRLGQWLGLCRQAAGDQRAARSAYALAARLPGPEPDPDIFPPDAMTLYRAARDPRSPVCRPQVPQTVIEIDGRPLEPNAAIAQGDHYLAWRTANGQAAGRVRLARDCQLKLPSASAPLQLAPSRIAPEELGQWLSDLGRAAEARRALLVSTDGATLEVALGRADGARVAQRSQMTIDPDRAASAVLADQLRRLLDLSPPPAASRPAVGAAVALPVGAPPPPTKSRPWYRRWWVWTLVGAAVVAAVAIPLAATEGEPGDANGAPPSVRYDLVF